MIYLLLAIVCSAALSIVMRLSEGRVKSNTGMIAANYLTCIVTACCMIGFGEIIPAGEAAPRTLGMGLINGFFYMSSLLVMNYNIRKNVYSPVRRTADDRSDHRLYSFRRSDRHDQL